MKKLSTALKGLANPDMWLDALAIIGGYKASAMLSAFVGERLAFVPDVLQPFVGPVLTFTVGQFVPGRIGKGLKIGAIVYAADQLLDMLGVPGLEG